MEARVAGEPIGTAGWSVAWEDRAAGIVRVRRGEESHLVAIEGSGRQWFAVVGGRRLEVDVSTWRERVLTEAEAAAGGRDGPVLVTATLPGLVVAVAVAADDEVEAGAALLTIEAMKMQNEVRSPRAGRIVEVSVLAGQVVATGAPLLRIE
jgi:biotin carboxyl carrier protein